MEKAIEIKRRAQRCVQNGDLDGALNEYEKLIASDDTDPYNFVLLADLLYKKGDTAAAAQRYLAAATAYEKAGLYKNGIAVCKKMMRLSLSQSPVLLRLAVLHELDGIATESALYYLQYAENLVREDRLEDAGTNFRKAFDTCPENIRALERLAEVHVLTGLKEEAAKVLLEVSGHYQRAGQLQDADRCRNRAAQLSPVSGLAGDAASQAAQAGPARLPGDLGIESTSAWVREPEAPAPPAPVAPPIAVEPEIVPTAMPVATGEVGPPRLDLDTYAEDAAVTESEHDLRKAEQSVAGPPRLAPSPEDADAVAAGADSEEETLEIVTSVEPDEEEVVFDLDEAAAAVTDAPGLQFESPVAAAPAPEPIAEAPVTGLQRVEKLLANAQQHFRSGEREAAGIALSEAAHEYDEIGQHDSAATIYRSLGKSATAGVDVMMLWLANCERRADHVEAAQVACDLGDRALNDGDSDGARSWFERARAFDPSNMLAQRRLQRLDAPAGSPPAPDPVPAATPAAAAPPSTNGEMGRVEVAVGRGEAVTFDLSSLVSEFQRGVEMQLSGDSQGHYDLGMAYREMGLLEQSVEAFRTAGRDPGFSHRSAEMIGRCMLDQGRFDEAAQEFTEALQMPQVTPEQGADLRYQLGLAHEAAGRSAEALAEFESVYAVQSNYPDVALKIRVLRKALEIR